MFTGLIRDVGTVIAVTKPNPDERVFTIKTALPVDIYPLGASIACNGCCLTVTEKTADTFTVMASAETLSKTALADWTEGTVINVEPSLRMGDELGGHLVFGHCDGLATLETVVADGDSWRLTFRLPADKARYVASKGSVALDGISLTVNEVNGDTFGVNIIPYTWEHTNLSQRKVGDRLNFEIDMLARYVARLLDKDAA
jgi:riboflavin synthase